MAVALFIKEKNINVIPQSGEREKEKNYGTGTGKIKFKRSKIRN